ncbi:MAG: pyridoxal-phosphate dependent enzyme [Rhodospirillales bacterium]|jgi:cysteine synthase|nr:pyridoxal-phosphate dependent enzyme [Rhodospirillales bacterium]MDP6774964.1 pyridoxal-phosphate dependent enzyme [Rhodospirillales bacterium]
MAIAGLATDIADTDAYESAVEHLRQARVVLPTFAQLADPATIPQSIAGETETVQVGAPNAANLFRVHWYNDDAGVGRSGVPGYVELPAALTGVKARIAVAFGNRFPMIAAHKVLPAYACLAPRIVTGRFDPARHKAVWPSTGNYCRGGVAISRILGCRGVAVLPEGMSEERFQWLREWVTEPDDIVRTPGSESNVKEIYDKCAELAADPTNVILNQFSEFGNYLVHYQCTGRALEAVFEDMRAGAPTLELAAFVAGTGSAGTLGAGDYLKEALGARIVAVEPTECPTMLYNGYGEHNIQGIGDKHIPFIQNVMNMDMVVGVSDDACDRLNVLFNSDEGRSYLEGRRRIDPAIIARLDNFGLSSIANVLAAIKTARRLDLGPNDVIVTVATDGAGMYVSESDKTVAAHFPGGFDAVAAGETFAQHLLGTDGDHVLELTHADRERIFNLGYYTWVEQQGVALEDFDARRDQRFWKGLRDLMPEWDGMIDDFNRRTGVNLPG